jgi:hypothetical protein
MIVVHTAQVQKSNDGKAGKRMHFAVELFKVRFEK